jgi:hypothetical protein
MRQVIVDRIDPPKAYEYFLRTQGWSKEMVDQQVLTPLDPAKIIGTEPDQDSIMCYQLPGAITKDGKPIRGGLDINPLDSAFTATVYPKILRDTGAPATTVAETEVPLPRSPVVMDWDPQEDALASL